MTCIVGLVDKGTVYIGADSLGVGSSYECIVRADRKVFRNGDFIMGFTTSFRMGQLLTFKLKPPKRHADIDPYEYMVTDFVDAVRDCLKSGGYATKDKEAEVGGTFLVGYAGRLFKVEGDYQVGEAFNGMMACGCGADFALGSLFSSTDVNSAETRVRNALSAAEQFSAGVRAPFFVETLYVGS